MSKITINFFGETITIEKPKSLSSLRNEISRLFCFSAQDAAEIILTYNDNGDKAIIANDDDLKAFLNSKVKIIDLDISQNSKIYKDNLNQLQEESIKDKKCLEELLKKKEELKKLRDTKFTSERKEIFEIHTKIYELNQKKSAIRVKILRGLREIEKQEKENNAKIMELQKKLGLPIENEEKKPENKIKRMMPFYHRHHPMLRFGPPFHMDTAFTKKPKFGKTEYIEFPKEETTENNESNEYDLKMRTIDDWGKCLLNKAQEMTNKLAETFKGFPTLNISLENESLKKEEEKEEKEEKAIHRFVICDGCNMKPVIGKRYKCKTCNNFDFCEKCYEKNKKTHGHEFDLIEKPVYGNLYPTKTHHYHKINPFPRHQSKGNELKLKGVKPEYIQKIMEHCPNLEHILKNKVHVAIRCDGCKKCPIVGTRFKCAVCDDFDFCEKCEKKFSEKHNHPFLKIYDPIIKPSFFQFYNKK